MSGAHTTRVRLDRRCGYLHTWNESQNLTHKFIGQFSIEWVVNPVAVRLNLPKSVQIYPTQKSPGSQLVTTWVDTLLSTFSYGILGRSQRCLPLLELTRLLRLILWMVTTPWWMSQMIEVSPSRPYSSIWLRRWTLLTIIISPFSCPSPTQWSGGNSLALRCSRPSFS